MDSKSNHVRPSPLVGIVLFPSSRLVLQLLHHKHTIFQQILNILVEKGNYVLSVNATADEWIVSRMKEMYEYVSPTWKWGSLFLIVLTALAARSMSYVIPSTRWRCFPVERRLSTKVGRLFRVCSWTLRERKKRVGNTEGFVFLTANSENRCQS